MDAREQALSALTAKPIDQLLPEMVGYTYRANAGEKVKQPLLSLHLRTGRSVTGHLLDVSEPNGNHGRQVLLRPSGESGVQFDVIYVALASVEAVTLHNAPSMLAPPEPIDGKSPLQLRRELAAFAVTFGERLGKTVTTELRVESSEPLTLQVLTDVVEQTAKTLLRMTDDPMAKAEFAEKLQSVVVSLGPTSSVTLQGPTLVIETAPTWPQRVSSASLLPLIEKVF